MFESALSSSEQEEEQQRPPGRPRSSPVYDSSTPHAGGAVPTYAAAAADLESRRAVCLAGVARCTLRSGDLRRGLRLARDAGSPQLFRECASILEGMKQPGEAAAMYELGGQEDRAAAIYVAGKDLEKAAAVMPKVTLPKLLGQYAKACEITGRCVLGGGSRYAATDRHGSERYRTLAMVYAWRGCDTTPTCGPRQSTTGGNNSIRSQRLLYKNGGGRRLESLYRSFSVYWCTRTVFGYPDPALDLGSNVERAIRVIFG